MPIVFVDQRISVHSSSSGGTTTVTATPLFIGDIGIQTLAVANTAVASDVRVALNGTVNLLGGVETVATVTLTIERNGAGTAGTGTLIYTETFDTDGEVNFSPLSITTGDFPSLTDVNAGQIRYTLFVASSEDITLLGPVGFNGTAVAGAN